MARKIVAKKNCHCTNASASGPRCVVTAEVDKESGLIVYTFRSVALACNTCDVPWTVENGPGNSEVIAQALANLNRERKGTANEEYD